MKKELFKYENLVVRMDSVGRSRQLAVSKDRLRNNPSTEVYFNVCMHYGTSIVRALTQLVFSGVIDDVWMPMVQKIIDDRYERFALSSSQIAKIKVLIERRVLENLRVMAVKIISPRKDAISRFSLTDVEYVLCMTSPLLVKFLDLELVFSKEELLNSLRTQRGSGMSKI